MQADRFGLLVVRTTQGCISRTFLGFERAPQVSAVITNLADEAHLVARMRDALAGEMSRRQELLRSAGGFANIGDYARARNRGAALAGNSPALPGVPEDFLRQRITRGARRPRRVSPARPAPGPLLDWTIVAATRVSQRMIGWVPGE